MDEREVLHKILTIVGYKDSKLQFITTFFAYIYTEAIAEIGTSLSKDVQIKLADALEHADDEESQRDIILKYVPKEEFDKLLTVLTQTQLSSYIDAVFPTLPQEKQEALTTYLRSLEKP